MKLVKYFLFVGLIYLTGSVAYQLPAFEKLSPFWQEYFHEVDESIEENFWGNLGIFKKTKLFRDPYIKQMESMGYNFEDGQEQPAPFYQSLTWVFTQIQSYLDSGVLREDDVLWPGKAFEYMAENGKIVQIFVPIGGNIPANAQPLNLLSPELFVKMLDSGFFPISNAEREHTNQTLAEHDLAHMAGFVSSPRYTRAIRQAFRRISYKMASNPRVAQALQHFESAYSLRVYYIIEVFTEIPKEKISELQRLIEIPFNQKMTREIVVNFLLEKAKDPKELYRYLSILYWRFHSLVNPLGGESRDLFNRRRKFHREGALGTYYDDASLLHSKFTRNSLYSLFLNAKAILENKRSNHPDFIKSICEVHATFLGALIGASQLEIEDWVVECVEEIPNPNSKLYQYIHDSGFWHKNHLLYQAFVTEDYDRIVS